MGSRGASSDPIPYVFGLPPIVESLQGPVDTGTVAQDTTTQPPSFEDSLLI